ncbi:MAG: hypothetical protein ACI90V_002128 [Bacillariaceae sp.]|jgi:hypothetical protein
MIGLRLISDGRDLRGRFDLAHFAALSLTCFANNALQREKIETKKRRKGKRSERAKDLKKKNDGSRIDSNFFLSTSNVETFHHRGKSLTIYIYIHTHRVPLTPPTKRLSVCNFFRLTYLHL